MLQVRGACEERRKAAPDLVQSVSPTGKVIHRASGACVDEVNHMTKHPALPSVLLASGVLLMAACASQPEGSLADKQFQRAAKKYQKFERDGQTVYCMMANTRIVPQTCLSEAELRKQVDDYERSRNAVSYTRSPPG